MTRPTQHDKTKVKHVPQPRTAPVTTTGEIDLVDDRTATAADLVQEGAKLVRSYGTLHGKAATTAKKLAVVVLRLRTRYTDKNGRPDLCGTSQEYRDAVRALYDSAGVPTDAASTLQATVRYHVSELRVDYMRANGFTDEDFRYYQIDTESKRARQVAAARERRQALREAASRAEAWSRTSATRREPSSVYWCDWTVTCASSRRTRRFCPPRSRSWGSAETAS